MIIPNNLVIATLILSMVSLLIIPSSVHATTCTYSEKYYTLPQIFTLSSNVFVGTVTTINNDTSYHWDVNFSIEKLWKGTPNQKLLTIKTNSLRGCEYSITAGEKYLVYTISSPPFLQTSWTKVYAGAQYDISLLNDPSFQKNVQTKEDLNTKLEAAKTIIGNMMLSKTSDIPLNGVGVDMINSTLHVGIDNTKATMSKEEYEKQLKNVLGDIPIIIEFGQNVLDSSNTNETLVKNPSPSSSMMPPLKQFKSGVIAKDIQCKQELQLIFKTADGTPACVKPQTVFKLVEREWGLVDSSMTKAMSIDNTKFSTNYTITNAKILNIKMDTQSRLIIVTMQSSDDGNLIIQIPQDLLKDTSNSGLHYAGLIVLNDGQESSYKEIKITHDKATLLIPFVNGTRQIEIIPTYY